MTLENCMDSPGISCSAHIDQLFHFGHFAGIGDQYITRLGAGEILKTYTFNAELNICIESQGLSLSRLPV